MWKDFIIEFFVITIVGGTISGLLVHFLTNLNRKNRDDDIPSTSTLGRKRIIPFPIGPTEANEKNKKREKLKKWIWIAIGGIGSALIIVPILAALSDNKGKGTITEPPDLLKEVDEYFVSVAVSDTISDNFEPAKKIVVTASDDTENITLTGESSTKVFGPFNMTMESSRRFSFIAVFEEPDEYIITIKAVSKEEEVATEKISIDAQADFGITMPDYLY
ncbi:hypothetical protein EDD76_108184 [Kineothrix alysoides]|uniref:Uncharacterized protein n=2 Tax=Kineothrix alysoides TaxID=1469948 RepID=A0A4R1QUK1_9FIRM|nr:hypothetical protein EDD76_108184 [Kineothrix alysoides]